jgi:hypothetical protein
MPLPAVRRSPLRAALAVLAFAGALLVGSPAPASADPGIPAGEAVQRTITYEVRTRGAVYGDLGTFSRVASQTMNDRRGWSLGGSVRYVQVPSGGSFTLWLAAPSELPKFSSVCSPEYSCRVGRNVIINDLRWRTGTPTWPAVREYRDYVVNHELGHWLGRGHTSCPGRGGPAPVMMQQSIGLGGCVTNTWPLAAEKQAVASALGVAVRSVRPDLYAVDQRGTTVEVIDGGARYTAGQGRFPTALPATRPLGWEFAVADLDRDGIDDLVGIKTEGGSGRVEVNALTGASGFRQWLIRFRTALPARPSSAGWFSVADVDGDGHPDLVAVDRQPAGNRTTVDVLSGATRFTTYLVRGAVTPMRPFSADLVDFDLGDHDRDGVPDLYVVNRRGRSGGTEVHVLDGKSRFTRWSAHANTPLGATDTAWDFAVDDWDGDGWDEVYALRRDGSSGRTGVHVLADRTYTSWVAHAATPLPQTAGQPHWRFAVD